MKPSYNNIGIPLCNKWFLKVSIRLNKYIYLRKFYRRHWCWIHRWSIHKNEYTQFNFSEKRFMYGRLNLSEKGKHTRDGRMIYVQNNLFSLDGLLPIWATNERCFFFLFLSSAGLELSLIFLPALYCLVVCEEEKISEWRK